MDQVINFYNNLFTIEIAVFGIIAAAFFVFIQIIYSKFSYREISTIFRNLFLALYLITSLASLILTALASLLLSFEAHDFIPSIDFESQSFFSNEYVGLSLLFLFLLSLGLFVGFVLSNIKYIRPSRIALLISEKTKNKDVRNFLLKEYGIPAPDGWMFLPRLHEGFEDANDELISIILPSKKKKKPSKTKKKEIERKKKERQEKLKLQKEFYEDEKQKIEKVRNPFDPLNSLIIKAITSTDTNALSDACITFQKIFKNFLEDFGNDTVLDEWTPEHGIVEKFVNYLKDTFAFYIQLCERERLDIAMIKILDTSKIILDDLIERGNFSEIKHILSLWKSIADRSISRNSHIFGKVIQLYSATANKAFKEDLSKNENWIEEVFRHLGWIGERLLSKQGVEEKPIMHDDDYYNEYDALLNALLNYSYEYNNKYSFTYPLIYFDAIYVIFRQLVRIYKETEKHNIKDHIFSCAYTYASFAKHAIESKNSKGAALAAMRLEKCYEHLIKKKADQCAKDTISLLVSVGAKAAGNKDKLSGVEFMRNPIDEYLIEIIKSSPYQSEINHEIREVFIKERGDRDAIWKFITTLGNRMKTNFGFMFDWETEELYSKDDPRIK